MATDVDASAGTPRAVASQGRLSGRAESATVTADSPQSSAPSTTSSTRAISPPHHRVCHDRLSASPRLEFCTVPMQTFRTSRLQVLRRQALGKYVF